MTKHQGTYHVGLFYFPAFIKEERWYYPIMLFVVEEKSEFILGMAMLKKEEVPTIHNQLLDIFAEHHLVPENIIFSDKYLLSLCKDILMGLRIKYAVDNDDEILFNIWEDMGNQLTRM